MSNQVTSITKHVLDKLVVTDAVVRNKVLFEKAIQDFTYASVSHKTFVLSELKRVGVKQFQKYILLERDNRVKM